jgi:hypothetical protein
MFHVVEILVPGRAPVLYNDPPCKEQYKPVHGQSREACTHLSPDPELPYYTHPGPVQVMTMYRSDGAWLFVASLSDVKCMLGRFSRALGCRCFDDDRGVFAVHRLVFFNVAVAIGHGGVLILLSKRSEIVEVSFLFDVPFSRRRKASSTPVQLALHVRSEASRPSPQNHFSPC